MEIPRALARLATLTAIVVACGPPKLAQPPPTPGPTCTLFTRALVVSDQDLSQEIEGMAQTKRVVAVQFDAKQCTLEVLPGCTVPGAYAYQRLNDARRVLRIHTTEELTSEFPLQAVALGATLARKGELAFSVWSVGRYYASQSAVKRAELQGACDGVTHIVSGLKAGAYDFSAGDSVSVEAEASFMKFGARLQHTAGSQQIFVQGDFDACKNAGPESPPAQCSAPLGLELVPVLETAASTSAPAECPAGMAKIPGGGTVGAFCLDVSEVTAGDFAKCVASNACTTLPTTSDWPGSTPEAREARTPFCNGGKADKVQHPMNCVDKLQAAQYCESIGKRLPSQDEWVWAASSGGTRKFPWGDGPAEGRACAGPSAKSTCPVGSFPAGDGGWGVHDLAGNVWEITFSAAGTNRYMVCGGAWGDSDFPSDLEAHCPYWMEQSVRSNIVGFRCARAL